MKSSANAIVFFRKYDVALTILLELSLRLATPLLNIERKAYKGSLNLSSGLVKILQPLTSVF